MEIDGHRSHRFEDHHRPVPPFARDAFRLFHLLRSGTLPDRRTAGYARPAGHAGHTPNRGDTAVPAWTGPDAEPALSRLAPAGHVRRLRRLVRRRRLRQVRYQRQHRGLAAAQTLGLLAAGPDVAHRRGGGRGVPLAARLAPADAGPRRRSAGRHGVPPRARHGMVAGCRWAHGTRPRGSCTGPPRRDPAPGRGRPRTAPGSGGTIRPTRGGCWPRPPPRTRRRAATRTCAPDDDAPFRRRTRTPTRPTDDFYWAAAELWLATGEHDYPRTCAVAGAHPDVFDLAGFDFDRVAAPARLDLALHGPGLPTTTASGRRVPPRTGCSSCSAQPWGQPYAPADGWDWGSNGRILNNLVVLAVAHAPHRATRVPRRVAAGMDYLLGRNALGQSYVTGYGTDDSRHQRTRQFGHDLDPTFPPPPPARSPAARLDRTPTSPTTRGSTGCRPSVLSRRTHLRGHQRHLHPVERAAGLRQQLFASVPLSAPDVTGDLVAQIDQQDKAPRAADGSRSFHFQPRHAQVVHGV